MYVFNPRKKSYGELKNSMVGSDRWDILDNILKEMAIKRGEGPKQHWLLIGPRGIGKSHLVALLNDEVQNKHGLSKQWVSVLFPEELRMESNLSRVLERALTEIIIGLEKKRKENTLAEEFRKKINYIKGFPIHNRADHFFSLISEFYQKTGKHILLLAENLQHLLGKKFSLIDQKKLRSFLQTSNALLIIGTATTVFDALHDHSHPFYHFFHIRRLEDLSFEDMKTLMVDILSQKKILELRKEVIEKDARLRTLYSFTGGNPRMVIFLADILSTEIPDEMIELMDRILDELTPYFLTVLQGIPDHLEDILNILAAFEPAQSPKEIAEHLELPQTTVRNYLKHLKDNGYVRVAFSKGLSNYYVLNEYLYRIWFQMRDGSRREENRWLMELLLMVYSRDTISKEKNRLSAKTAGTKSVSPYKKLIDQVDTFIDYNPDFYGVIQSCVNSMVLDKKDIEEVDYKEQKFREGIYGYLNKSQYKKAIKECKDFMKDNPKSELPYLYWGLCLKKKGDKRKAIEKYEKAIELNPKSEKGYLFLGEYLMEQGLFDDAIEKYKKAMDIDSESEQVFLLWGECLRKQGLHEEAIKKYKNVIYRNSKSEQGYLFWGECLREQKNYDEAMEKYKRVTEINSYSEQGYLLWAECLWENDCYEEAMEKYRKALELNPNSEQAYKGYGEYLRKSGRYGEAIKKFEKVIDINPWSAENYRMLGECLHIAGRSNEAIDKFERMIELNSMYEEGYRSYGECLWASGKRIEAMQKFKKVIELNPMSEEGYRLLGSYLWKSGDYREAMKNFERMIEINSRSEKVYQTLLRNLEVLKHYEEAIIFFDKVMPDSKDCSIDSIRVKNYDSALKRFEKLIYNRSEYYSVYLLYGQLLEKRENKEGALLAYLMYIKVCANNYTVYFDFQGIHHRYVEPLSNSLNSSKYIKQFYGVQKGEFSDSHLNILLLLLEKYDMVSEHIHEIIKEYQEKTGEKKGEFELLVFTIKLSIWLKLSEEKFDEVSRLVELYLQYIKTLRSTKEKENEVLNFCLDLFSIQINLNIGPENIKKILNRIEEEKEVPFSDVIFKVWLCISEPDSVEAKRYLSDLAFKEVVEGLKRLKEKFKS